MKTFILVLFLQLVTYASVFSLELKGIDLRVNKLHTIKLKPGRATVYYFLSASCPCSQGSFDHLNQLQRQFKDFNFVGFHSSVAIDKKSAIEYFSQYKIDFPILFDPDVKFADHFKALKTPHVFVYNKDNELVFQGAATNSRNPNNADKFYLRDALSSLVENKEIKVKYAKAIGCYIQRN